LRTKKGSKKHVVNEDDDGEVGEAPIGGVKYDVVK
jgi:hypothetical protein